MSTKTPSSFLSPVHQNESSSSTIPPPSELFSHASTKKADQMHAMQLQLSQIRHSLQSLGNIAAQLDKFQEAIQENATKHAAQKKSSAQGGDLQSHCIKINLPILANPLCFIEAEYRLSQETFTSLGQGYFQKMSLGQMQKRIEEKFEMVQQEESRLEKQIEKLNRELFRGTNDIDELFATLELEEQLENEKRQVDSGNVDEEFDKYFVKEEDAERNEGSLLEEMQQRRRGGAMLRDASTGEDNTRDSEDSDSEIRDLLNGRNTDLDIKSYGAVGAKIDESLRKDEDRSGEIAPSTTLSTKKHVTFHRDVKDNSNPPTAQIDLPVPPRNPALIQNIHQRMHSPTPPILPSAAHQQPGGIQKPLDLANAPIREKSTVSAPPKMPGVPSFMPMGRLPSMGKGGAPPNVPTFPQPTPIRPEEQQEDATPEQNIPKRVSRFMQQFQGK